MRIKLSVVLFISLLMSSFVFAQNDDDWWDDDYWNDDLDFNVEVFNSDSRPFIELNYGSPKVLHKLIGNDIFNNLGFGELKLGYFSSDNLDESHLVEFDESYFFISNISKDLDFNSSTASSGSGVTKLDGYGYRIGFADRDGYGYKFESISFNPYHQSGINWSKLTITAPNLGTLPPIERMALERFNKDFRFGTTNEAGINIGLGDGFISLNTGYEFTVIFPRYLIWKHLGSFIIESIAQKSIDSFVDEVMDRSPLAGPIVNFALKNGLSYAFYSLKKEDMNWPFSTEEPLTFETFKFGISINF